MYVWLWWIDPSPHPQVFLSNVESGGSFQTVIQEASPSIFPTTCHSADTKDINLDSYEFQKGDLKDEVSERLTIVRGGLSSAGLSCRRKQILILFQLELPPMKCQHSDPRFSYWTRKPVIRIIIKIYLFNIFELFIR